MEKIPLSVVVLTYNEEKNIRDCLASVSPYVSELFVVDSGSTDQTVAIAKEYTANISLHSFEYYAQQRNWAQDNLPLRNEWVFHLDADERVTPELREELRQRFSRSTAGVEGFFVSRRTVFMGRWIRHGGHYPAYHLRIFKKTNGRCEDRLYDQHFYVTGTTEILRNDLIDTVACDVARLRASIKRSAQAEARELIRARNGAGNGQIRDIIKGDRHGTAVERKRWWRERYYRLPLFVRPCFYFCYRFFILLGFLDGWSGVVFHILQGFWYRLLVDVAIFRYMRSSKK